MKLTSPAFDDNQVIPPQYAYKTGNTSPPLAVSNIPINAACLSLIVYDPDAPSGNFNHWLVWNLPPLETINEGKLPDNAILGRNDYGNYNWDGPAPPSGTHRYIFKLYALEKPLTLKYEANRTELELAMAGHILATTQLTGLYRTDT